VLAATRERIEEEKLVAFSKGKETLLYHRRVENGRDEYELGDALEGGKEVHEVWKRVTAPGQMFLSQAVANSSSELQQLRVPFTWLTGEISCLSATMVRGFANLTQNLAQDHPEYLSELLQFIGDLDIPIAEIKFVPDSSSASSIEQPSVVDRRLSRLLERRAVRPVFTHKTVLGEASFDYDEESRGTQSLYGFFFPWNIFQTAGVKWNVLVVDELDTSLHPKIVQELVRRHLKKPFHSQLIFTTHDTHLMDAKLLRRDQIWLTERDMNGATQLRSVHDFEGREGEDIEKRYYEGRYRGLPIVRSE
jgi:hypothetical protein